MLKILNVNKSFEKKQPLLNDISLLQKSGSAVCIAGENAAGKTTLLRLACGLLLPDSGIIECGGKISFAPQEPVFLPKLTVYDNLLLWYAAKELDYPPFSEDSAETRLGLLPFSKKRADTLSGGMKKRLSIAFAMAGSPDFLLLDEPFAALDAPGCDTLCKLLCRLKAQGVGILFTSHEPQHIATVADMLFLLKEGRLSCSLELESLSAAQRLQSVLAMLFGDI